MSVDRGELESEHGQDETRSDRRPQRREVEVDLTETTPDRGGLFHWVLASPLLMYMAWVWSDLAVSLSPIPFAWLNVVLGLVMLVIVVILPLGLAAEAVVARFPRVFGRSGWDVQPLEPVRETEIYTVRLRIRHKTRAPRSWPRLWMRAAQGWVYLEIALILVGGVLIIPLFFSATEFGFGR